VASKEFIATVIAGHIAETMMVQRKGTGMGSAVEDLCLLDLTKELTELPTTGWKVQNTVARGIGVND